MAGIIGTLVYNTIYPLTLSFWPGFCFATGFFLSFIPLSMMGCVFYQSKTKDVHIFLALSDNGHTFSIKRFATASEDVDPFALKIFR